MYTAITEKFNTVNQSAVAKQIGIRIETMNRIVNRKQNCPKTTAYCIVKAICQSAEIEDYFKRKGE